jgi:uncharacterized membrane protein YfhO
VSVSRQGDSRRRLLVAAGHAETLIVTGEPYYPGWRAESGGAQLNVRRVGYLAAVAAPRGSRAISLSYRPPWLLPGFAVSALALAACVFVLWRCRPARGAGP